jgi:hypothetical protein
VALEPRHLRNEDARELGEPGAEPGISSLAGVVDRGLASVEVEPRDRLAQAEVARRPGIGAAEMAREEPVRGPLTQAALGDDRRLDLVVRQRLKSVEIEVRACQGDDVLGLPPREPERGQLLRRGRRQQLAGRKAIGVREGRSEAADKPRPDGKRSMEGHLLGRDRPDKRFERVRGERRPKAPDRFDDPREHGLAGCETGEGI